MRKYTVDGWDILSEEGEPVYHIPPYDKDGNQRNPITVMPASHSGKILMLREKAAEGQPENLWTFPHHEFVTTADQPLDWYTEARKCLTVFTGMTTGELHNHHIYQDTACLSKFFIAFIDELEEKAYRYKSPKMEYRIVDVRQWCQIVNSKQFDTSIYRFSYIKPLKLIMTLGDNVLEPVPELLIPKGQ